MCALDNCRETENRNVCVCIYIYIYIYIYEKERERNSECSHNEIGDIVLLKQSGKYLIHSAFLGELFVKSICLFFFMFRYFWSMNQSALSI